ncbi:MAG: TraB/GumN family protein [Treponema sp.]|nr:TraB/GumN family protein [Treponema sp.]MCL2230718.1 TraB/GumN family protein [Treponema sp.]MCL2236919.1 TraB/GumN family protein [Treponema sp.]
MSESVTTITLNGREFKLIGTAHVSRESIEEVKRIIGEEKPDVVCVELDQARYNSIVQNDTWEKLDLAKVFKEGKGFLLIANLVLSSFQRRLGNEVGVKPGEEMKTAIETAKAAGIAYSLCDREVHTTLRRAWAKCGLWSKSKLLASLLASAFTTEKLTEKEIEELKNKNELDGMMNELANYLPAVKTVLIDERDRYLASKIWTSTANGIAPKKIAAVVGAGHMQGMIAYMEKLSRGEVNTDVSELDVIPPPSFLSKAAGFLIPAALIALIVAGFFMAGKDVALSMVLRWVLWNGSLAALGSLIALAHPLAILVSFLGAPIATLNPLIGVGLFSGLVQIAFKKPRVSDAQNITEDATNIKGFYRNRITKALLVFFLSSIGAMIGNFISIPALAGLLGG